MYVKVRVFPSSKKERWVQKTDTSFEVSVREPAERNMANTRVIELTAEHFGVARGKVRIITGHRSPGKVLSVDI